MVVLTVALVAQSKRAKTVQTIKITVAVVAVAADVPLRTLATVKTKAQINISKRERLIPR